MKIKKEKLDNIIFCTELFLLGFVSFSLISRYLFINILKWPMVFTEIFWILFFLLNFKRFIKDCVIIKNKKFLLACAFLLVLTLFSIMRGSSEIKILSYVQSLAEMVFFIIVFMDYEKVDVDKIWWMTFGTLCGDIIYLMMLTNDNFITVNHIAWVVCYISSFLVKGKYKIIISYVLGFVASVFSGYRLNIILILVSLLVCLLWEILRKRENNVKNFIGRIFVCIVFVFCGIFLYSNLIPIIEKIATVFNFDGSKIYRVVNRLEMFFTGSAGTTDAKRIKYVRMIFTEFDNQLFPTGILRGLEEGSSGLYVDAPIILFYEIFGSVITCGLLVFFTYWAVKLIVYGFRTVDFNKEYVFAALTIPAIYILFLLNGFFIIANASAVITGILLGIIFRYIRENINLKKRSNKFAERSISYERGLENEKNCSCADEA